MSFQSRNKINMQTDVTSLACQGAMETVHAGTTNNSTLQVESMDGREYFFTFLMELPFNSQRFNADQFTELLFFQISLFPLTLTSTCSSVFSTFLFSSLCTGSIFGCSLLSHGQGHLHFQVYPGRRAEERYLQLVDS